MSLQEAACGTSALAQYMVEQHFISKRIPIEDCSW